MEHYSLVSSLHNNNAAPTGIALKGLAVLLPAYVVHRMAAAQQCTYTLPTAAASNRNMQACRTAAGDVVFKAANPHATHHHVGADELLLLPTSVSITVLIGQQATPSAATWTTVGAAGTEAAGEMDVVATRALAYASTSSEKDVGSWA
eukprot:m51a1_g4431 hypothetical protein (148) ;mRNA; r:73684-74173